MCIDWCHLCILLTVKAKQQRFDIIILIFSCATVCQYKETPFRTKSDEATMRSCRLVAMTILSAQHRSIFNMLFMLRPNKGMLSVYLPGLRIRSPLNDNSGSDHRRVLACIPPLTIL